MSDSKIFSISNDRNMYPEIHYDEQHNLFYGYWKGKRLYLKRSIDSLEKAKIYFLNILKDQDMDSPYCYTRSFYEVKQNDVVVDAGAESGFFALEQVDIAKRIFVVEGDKEWMEALECTFRPYEQRVTLVCKYLGNKEEGEYISLHTLNTIDRLSFIKMNLEGLEYDVIENADEIFCQNDKVTVLAYIYSKKNVYSIAQKFLEWNYRVEFFKDLTFSGNKEIDHFRVRQGLFLAQKLKLLEIFIWGAGKYAETVYQSVKQEAAQVRGMIDSNEEKQFTLWKNKVMIFPPIELLSQNYDYIVISTRWGSEDIIKQCENLGIDKGKIILYWEWFPDYSFINAETVRLQRAEEENKKYRIRLENQPYELGIYKLPIIKSSHELLQNLIEKGKSLCRFGDGEFEMMSGNERPWFQKPDTSLKEKLIEVFNNNNTNVLIAVANNLGNLDCYTESAADAIREYFSNGKRREIMQIVGTQRQYYDAYVSRPYIIYRDKGMAQQIFELWKLLWKDRNLVIVEGAFSRMGIGNDLFHGAHSIRRILCPIKNAFTRYDEIMHKVKEIAEKEDLILISLGPTATVLAYEAAICGYQAVDIGQLDNEYEWYLHKAQIQEAIQGKMVAEVSWGHNPEQCTDKKYLEQIVARID